MFFYPCFLCDNCGVLCIASCHLYQMTKIKTDTKKKKLQHVFHTTANTSQDSGIQFNTTKLLQKERIHARPATISIPDESTQLTVMSPLWRPSGRASCSGRLWLAPVCPDTLRSPRCTVDAEPRDPSPNGTAPTTGCWRSDTRQEKRKQEEKEGKIRRTLLFITRRRKFVFEAAQTAAMLLFTILIECVSMLTFANLH